MASQTLNVFSEVNNMTNKTEKAQMNTHLPNVDNSPEWLKDDGSLDCELTAEIEAAATEYFI